MSARWERLAHAGGVLAVIRLAAVPVLFAAERLADHPQAHTQPFLLPIGAALLLNPRLTAAFSAVALYALIALTYPDPTEFRPDAVGFEFTQVLFLAWMGAAATLCRSCSRAARARCPSWQPDGGRLVAQAVDAEDRAPVAGRGAARRGAAEPARRATAARVGKRRAGAGGRGTRPRVTQIREAVFDLHPYLLEQAGLGAAVETVAARAGKRGGFSVTVDVDKQAAGLHDQLLFAIARELVANCAKHAHASAVSVSIRQADDTVELAVVDDGRGIDPARAPGAAARAYRAGDLRGARGSDRRRVRLRLGPGWQRDPGARKPAGARRARLSADRRSSAPPPSPPASWRSEPASRLPSCSSWRSRRRCAAGPPRALPTATASPPTLPDPSEAPPGPLDDPGTRRSFGGTLAPAFTARVTKPLSERGGRDA
jgi:hypothetical protein